MSRSLFTTEMSAYESESPSSHVAAADLDGEMSINRTVKRAFDTLDSSPAKHSAVSNKAITIGDNDLDINTPEDCPVVSGLAIRRRIDEFQEMQEQSQSEPLQLHKQHASSSSLQNEMGSFSFDFTGMSDQEDELENIAESPIPCSQHDSGGEWLSSRPDAKILNEPGSSECFDLESFQHDSPQLGSRVLNKARSSEHLDLESPPSLLSVAERQIPCSRHDSGDGPSSKLDGVVLNDAGSSECIDLESSHSLSSPRSDSEIVDVVFPPRMKGLIQSIESDILSKLELRTRAWFDINCLRAAFDSIIKYNSSVTHVDAEVRATSFPRRQLGFQH